MTENAKTITFVAVGLAAVVVALLTRPTSADLDVQSLRGEVLTRNFTAPEDAKRLRIVRVDEDTATLREFDVAERDGLWTIPSKEGYAADAERQMAEAATSLMDREILSVESDSAVHHEDFGVIDPLSPRLEPGQQGVGTRVTMFDIHDEPLVDLIIGHPVRNAAGQSYVREAGRDVVYVIEIDSSKLSTNFEDWIEKDLLKMNPWDLRQVEIKDYSAELVPVMTQQGLAIQVAWDPRAEFVVSHDDQEGSWAPVSLRQFERQTGDYADFELASDEELNAAALNTLKSALDELRIVDVVRKPPGLSANLQAGEDFLSNPEARRDLMSRGFATASRAESGGQDEIISSDGELIATLQDGTEYVLRFGSLTDVDGDSASTAGEIDEPTAATGSEVHRYLFVMARFNEDAIERPELDPLPEFPETDSPTEPADESEAESDDPDGESAIAEANETSDADSEVEQQVDEEVERIIAERQRIEQENQRKLDEYQETLKRGRDNVRDLNVRFGDWYFVVANDTFNKLRLNRDSLIKKQAAETSDDDNADVSDFGAPGDAVPGLPDIR